MRRVVSGGLEGGRVRRERSVFSLVLLAALLVLVLGAPLALAGAPVGRAAPLSPEFLAWRALVRAQKGHALSSSARPALGLVPSPLDTSELAGAVISPRAVSYPSSYDLRTLDRVSLVKNQLPYGTCWAFSGIAALESRLLPGDRLDLSEDNLTLGAGFDTEKGAYDQGGNFGMSTAYFARWSGPVLETDDPYGDGFSPQGLAAVRHVQEILYVPGGTTGTDNDNIKYALTQYGGVEAAVRWDDKSYDAAAASYNYAGTEPVNHAVTICGWDDAYPASAFRSTPLADGAWLVRNSWGTAWGQGGYFWMSYYDRYCGSAVERHAVFGAVESATNYTEMYSYDPLGEVDTYGYSQDKVWGANVFTARADQSIVALGFYTPVPASGYTLYAGTSLDTLRPLGSGTLAIPGFHTVKLTSALHVTDGDPFAVAIRLVAPGAEFPLSVEYQLPGYSSQATAAPGQSFTRMDNGPWRDLTDWNGSANVCLKAYAGSADVGLAADVTPPRTVASGADGVWRARPVSVTLAAADPEPSASGVDYTEFRLDDGAWTRGARVDVTADGVHTLWYRSADKAGNLEEARSCVVRVDSAGPVCASRSTSVKRGGAVALRYLVSDVLSPQVSATVSVRTAVGAVKLKLANGAWQKAGAWKAWAFRCVLPKGLYQIVVRGADLAGNRESVVGRGTLRVF